MINAEQFCSIPEIRLYLFPISCQNYKAIKMEALENKITPCIEARNLIWIRSLISRDGRRSVCEYEAADAETVREVYRQVGINVKSAWIAEIMTPE